jgi:hypothetical protein
MNHNAKIVMQESKYVNHGTHKWLKIQSFALLVQKLSEYMKVGKTTMVMVLGLVDNERTFNNLTFMKSKFCN